jgi:hypothetical protein
MSQCGYSRGQEEICQRGFWYCTGVKTDGDGFSKKNKAGQKKEETQQDK